MNVGGMFTTANHEMMKTPVRRRQRKLERAAVMNDVLEMENIAAEIDEAQNLLYSIWFFLGMAAGNYHSCIAWFGELSMCIEFGLPNHLSGMNVKPFSP